MHRSVSFAVSAELDIRPLAHTALRMFPSSARSQSLPISPRPRATPNLPLLFALLGVSLPGGCPGVGGSRPGLGSLGRWSPASQSSPSPRWLFHAHPRGGVGGPGGVASEGRPPPPATPGSTPPAGAPGAHSGQPGDRPLGVRWPLPNGEDGPLGTSLPGPRASLQLRPPLLSLCSLLVTPHRELKPAGRRRGPWLTRPRVRSRLGLLTTQRNSWKPHTLCLC